MRDQAWDDAANRELIKLQNGFLVLQQSFWARVKFLFNGGEVPVEPKK
jgi:hypothetical protein